MQFRETFRIGKSVALGTALSWAFMILTSPLAIADHNGLHATACDEPDTVGGGTLGISPNSALGWDVGSGQCNGSFVVTRDPSFPSDHGRGIELGLRIEQRSVGQITRQAGNEYIVETGADPTSTGNRAWWNFHVSIAYDGTIAELKSLTLTIENLAGPNDPSFPVFDILKFPITDDRFLGSTPEYSDIYQFSQNPEFFPWFTPTVDNDANSTFDFNYAAEGMWRFTLEAKPQRRGRKKATVSMCVRTRNAAPLDNSVSACVSSESED